MILRSYSILLLTCSIYFQPVQAQIKSLSGNKISKRRVDNFMKLQMDSLGIPALSITFLSKGKVVYHYTGGIKNKAGEAVDEGTLFEAASLTKPVFAYAVHSLVKKSVLNLDTPLYRYYPYKDIEHNEDYKKITARMVLSHTSGFPNWRKEGEKLTINFKPGSAYGYSGEGYEYLGRVISHLTNKSLEAIIQEVFDKFSIKNSYMVKNEYVLSHLAEGLKDNRDWGKNRIWLQPGVAYSLCTNSLEYSKFVLGLMKESELPNSIFQNISVPQRDSEPGKSVCLGVFSRPTPYGINYFHSGNNNNRYNSNFEFYMEQGLAYVFFINCHQEPAFTKRLNEFLINGK